MKTGVVPNANSRQITTPPSIVRFRVRCGGGVRIRGEVRIRQSGSDFNEMNNLARAENGHNNGRLVTVPLTAKYITLSSVKVQKSIKHIARILHLPSVVQS